MQTLELPSYPTIAPIPKIPQVLSSESYLNIPTNPQTVLENAVNSIFPQPNEENKVIRMRTMLGETAKVLSDEQIETIITEFQFLIDTWLDEYEKEIFSGLTLKEVLNGGEVWK